MYTLSLEMPAKNHKVTSFIPQLGIQSWGLSGIAAFHNHGGIEQKLSDPRQAFCKAIFKKKMIESSVVLSCFGCLVIVGAGYFFHTISFQL